jgi:hypothetical protein
MKQKITHFGCHSISRLFEYLPVCIFWSGQAPLSPKVRSPRINNNVPNISMNCKVDLNDGVREFSSRPWQQAKVKSKFTKKVPRELKLGVSTCTWPKLKMRTDKNDLLVYAAGIAGHEVQSLSLEWVLVRLNTRVQDTGCRYFVWTNLRSIKFFLNLGPKLVKLNQFRLSYTF